MFHSHGRVGGCTGYTMVRALVSTLPSLGSPGSRSPRLPAQERSPAPLGTAVGAYYWDEGFHGTPLFDSLRLNHVLTLAQELERLKVHLNLGLHPL